jgi:hypothetical protein
MSIKVMQQVLESAPVDQGTLLVLIVLADSADEGTRECWPSVRRLAARARLSERQVQVCLRVLEDRKIISVVPNAGRNGTNLYRITDVSEWGVQKLRGGEAHFTGGVKPTSPGGVKPTSPEPSLRTVNEPSITREGLFDALEEPQKPKTDAFDRFWAAFPKCERKTERLKAKAAFERIVAGKVKGSEPVDPEIIIAGMERWAASGPDLNYAPLPTTWLNGQRWEQWQAPTPDRRARFQPPSHEEVFR